MKEDYATLVSIIVPAYNAERYIKETIKSVQKQIYKDWELIVIDDNSQDNTLQILLELAKKDRRIFVYSQNKHVGIAKCRNQGIEIAKGRYVAFLDSDDIWEVEKLTKQLNFMKSQGAVFSCTGYRIIDEGGGYLDKKVIPPMKADYSRVLGECPLGNSTVMIDTQKIKIPKIPDLKKRCDYVLWLAILKNETKYVYGLKEVLVSYRKRKSSVSGKKVDLVYYHWKIYRQYEKLSFFNSLYYVLHWVLLRLTGRKLKSS